MEITLDLTIIILITLKILIIVIRAILKTQHQKRE